LACHLPIDADPDPAYHFDADPDADPTFKCHADPDPQQCLTTKKGPRIKKIGNVLKNWMFSLYG
jgi:hypothetical protein